MHLRVYSYILIAFIIASFRTSNKKVFEEFTDINIPSTVKVTKEEYQDMGQHYVKTLELQLDKKSKADIKLSVLKSKFFNSSVYSDNGIYENQQLLIGDKHQLWYRFKNGFSFSGSTNQKRNIVRASIDTITMKVKFEYSAD